MFKLCGPRPLYLQHHFVTTKANFTRLFAVCQRARVPSSSHDLPTAATLLPRSAELLLLQCAVMKMPSFAASLLNRFTAFAHRTFVSFPFEPLPPSTTPFGGALPLLASVTYGQVNCIALNCIATSPHAHAPAHAAATHYSHIYFVDSCCCKRSRYSDIFRKLSSCPLTLAFWSWLTCSTAWPG